MKKILVRVAIVVAILVVVGLVAVYLSLDSIVKKGIEEVGPKVTKVDVHLDAVHLSVLAGGCELKKLFIGNPTGYKAPSAMEVGDIKVGVGIRSLLSDTIVVDEVNVQSADITFEGSLNGNDLTALLDNIKGAPAPETTSPPGTPAAKTASKKFIVKDLVLDGAKVNLDLTLPGLGEKTMTLPLPPLHLQNIGVAEGGVDAKQLVEQVMKPLLASVTQVATEQIANLAGGLKNIGKGGAKDVGDALKGFGGLLKK